MFNFLKNIMKKDKNVEGVNPEDMSLKELKELAISLGLGKKTVLEVKGKKELLVLIHQFEEDAIEAKNATKDAVPTKTTLNAPNFGEREGKKIISSTPLELNGKSYIDVLVESGETYRDEVK